MFWKSLRVLPLVGALVVFLTGSVPAQAKEPPQEEDEPPRTHTMTINNGCQVVQRTFVWENGSWRNGCADCPGYDVFCRDCPRSPWHFHGAYRTHCRAKEVAWSLRAEGILTSIRKHRPGCSRKAGLYRTRSSARCPTCPDRGGRETQ
jgi:hypothetical protein